MLNRLLALILLLSLTQAYAQAPPDVPSLPDAPRLTSYNINASTCNCAVNFALYGDGTDYQSWVEVWLNGLLVNYNDPTYGWKITSPTGTLGSIPSPITDAVLTFNAVQTGTVQIVGARRPRRLSQFPENQGVTARQMNQTVTDIIAENREAWDKINDVTGRALISQPGVTLGLLPLPGSCMGKLLGFDSTGVNPICSLGPDVPLPLSVANGGTGSSSFTLGLPLIGGSGVISQGTTSGNTTEFATVSGNTPANGDCASWSSGNLTDAGASCGAGGIPLASYGAISDLVSITGNTSIASGAAALTVVGAAFTTADCHTDASCTGATDKAIVIPGAGAAGVPLLTTITKVTSATQATVANNASTTLSAVSKTLFYGTDNTTAFNNWVTACTAGSQDCVFTRGAFAVTGSISITSALKIHGAGVANSFVYYLAPSGNLFSINTNSAVILSDFYLVGMPYATGGITAHLLDITGPYVNYGTSIENVWFSGGSYAIYTTNDEFLTIDKVNINNVGLGIWLADVAIPTAGVYLISNTNIGCNVTNPQGGAIQIVSGGNLSISNSVLHFCGYSLIVQPNIANFVLGDIYVTNTTMEQDSQACVILAASAASSQIINSVNFNGGDCGGGTPNGFYIGNSATDSIIGVQIAGMDIYPDSVVSSPAYGVIVHGGARSVTIAGNSFSGVGSNTTAIGIPEAGTQGEAQGNTFYGTTYNVLNSAGATFSIDGMYTTTIASLPSCTPLLAGHRGAVTNGVASPVLGATVSTTGAKWDPVICDGGNWIYH